MNCLQCQDLLSDYLDGDIAQNLRAPMQAHLANCKECHNVQLDLQQIVAVSQQLPLLAPDNALWQKIAQEIQTITTTKPPSLWQRIWHYKLEFSISVPQLAGSALCLSLLLLVANSFSYLPQRANLTTASPGTLVAQPASLTMTPQETELRSATERLDNIIKERRTSWDPELQSLFDRNMAIVNRSLEECLQFEHKRPNDQVTHEMIVSVYQEKLRVLEQFSLL